MYYYIDSPAEKTRYLYLDTASKSNWNGLSTAQAQFVKESLISTPDGWHIVAIAHIWNKVKWSDDGKNAGVATGLIAAAGPLVAMFDSYNLREGDYANCGGWVEFCIGGHCHRDHDSTSSTGIPIILVNTDSYQVVDGLPHDSGTTDEACVNGIIADYDNHKISVVRVGRGESREIFVTNPNVNYTNLLPISLDQRDMTKVLTDTDGSIGYLNDAYWAATAKEYRDNNTWDVTGLIPCVVGDTIYMKNITIPAYSIDDVGDGNAHGGLSYFKADGTTLINQSTFLNTQESMEATGRYWFDNDGNVVKATVPAWIGAECAYVQITAFDIKPNSIVTVNEVIE
jgi:hypothetical protein